MIKDKVTIPLLKPRNPLHKVKGTVKHKDKRKVTKQKKAHET